MFAVIVRVRIKPENRREFIEAMLADGRGSVQNAARQLGLVELADFAGLESLGGQSAFFFLGSITPVDVVRLAHRRHAIDPFLNVCILDHADGFLACPFLAVNRQNACHTRQRRSRQCASAAAAGMETAWSPLCAAA